MKQRHRVYTKEEDILAAIDRAKERLADAKAECVELQNRIKGYRRTLAKTRSANTRAQASMGLDFCERQSDRISKYVHSVEDVTLPRLKRTLAAFRTKTFDFMGDYRGVVAA